MKLQDLVYSLRRFRKYHRVVGLTVAGLVVISALTGILLAFKKDVAAIQPPTIKGTTKSLSDFRPLLELSETARLALVAAHPDQQSNSVDRMDVRPSKGMIKVLFEEGNWEVQIDGVTGEILSIAKRHSDWIESLHDGSIVADWFKLVSMNVLGWGLLILTISGFWLWFGPRRVRRMKKG